MPFTRKSQEPIPPVSQCQSKNAWLKKYFNWEPASGENYMTAIKPIVEEFGEGEVGWEEVKAAKAPLKEDPRAVADAGEKMVTISQSQLEKLASDIEKRLEAKFQTKSPQTMDVREFATELAEQISPTPGNRRRLMKEEDIDMSDYLEEPVMFYTYRIYHAIFSEKRYGQEVSTPYNRPIRFTNIATNIQGGVGRNGKQVLQISAAQITTKKELEWLRRSPNHGVVFFESVRDLQNVDRERAKYLADAMSQISTLTEYQIMQRAVNAGIPANKDVEVLRLKLIQKVADEAMAIERNVSTQAASTQDAPLEAVLKRGINPAQVNGANLVTY